MQVHGGNAAELAITSSERTFLAEIKVDWNGDGNFSHPLSNLHDFNLDDVTLDRSLSGSAPQELLLVEGSGSADLNITLSGEYNGMSLTAVFSPYNPASPLYGATRLGAEVVYTIIVDTDSGPIRYQQFVGKIRTITPDRASNTVEITALDRAEECRKPIRLAPWAISDEHINYGETDSQLAYSHWVIDNCLRLCDISPGPKRPVFREELGVPDYGLDGVQVYVTGNGSYIPTVGYKDNPNADSFPTNGTPMYRMAGAVHPGMTDTTFPFKPFGLAGLGLPIRQRYSQPADQGIIRYWSQDQDNINPTATHYMGFTLNTNGVNGTAFQTIGEYLVMEVVIGMARTIEVRIGAGKVWTRRVRWNNNVPTIEGTSAQVTIPTGQDNVDVLVQWDNTPESGSRSYVRAGSNATSYATTGSPVTSGEDTKTDSLKGRVTIGQGLGMSDIFYAVRNIYNSIAPDPGQAWRPAKHVAMLDIGRNRFSHMPYGREAKEAWDIIKDVAAAEWGAVFFDENGVFQFYNQDTIKAYQNIVRRELSLDDVTGLKITDSIDSVRNSFTVATNKKRAVLKGGPVYQSNDVNEFYVPARTERTFAVFVDNVLSPIPFRMQKFISKEEYNSGTGLWPVFDTETTTHGYCVQYHDIDNTGLWRELHDRVGVDVNCYFSAYGWLTVRIWNGWEEPIRLAAGSATDTPSPAFHIGGTEIYDDDTVSVITKDRASIEKYGTQNIELSGEWYQDIYESRSMFDDLILKTREPVPTTDAITIAGDPRLQLADTLGLSDPSGVGEGMRVQILGIRRQFGKDSGLEDTLTVEMLNPTPLEAPEGPPAPENLTVTFFDENTIYLDWDDVSDAFFYKIYDETNEPLGVAQGGTPFQSFSLRQDLPDGSYRFKVTAVNSYGESAASNVVAFNIPFV